MASTTLLGVLLSGTHAGRPSASSVASGTLYAETDTGAIYQSNSSSWSAWGSVGTSNPMTTKGDVILGDTGGVPTRLAAGTSTYVFTSNGAGAFPSWQAPGGGGGGGGTPATNAAALVTAYSLFR